MKGIDELVRALIRLRRAGRAEITLLAVCPNSAAVAEAAVRAAQACNAPMLFAATLNQVDRNGGYTGWTPAAFVQLIQGHAARLGWEGPLYPCLDHGGPWLKDRHALDRLPLEAAMSEVKLSLSACLQAGYRLLHIDPTVELSEGRRRAPPIEVVVERTIELIAHAESERRRLGLPPISYEVGTEEVHGGLVDFSQFEAFLQLLQVELERAGLAQAWPCFFVAQVGTDLHTTAFDAPAAQRLYARVSGLGSLIKGHYTDGVDDPAAYPAAGMGGANVGPEFTAEEHAALSELAQREAAVCRERPELSPSNILGAIEAAVVRSDRWRKWLQPEEQDQEFGQLPASRRAWLVQTGARYIWSDPQVAAARRLLYGNLGDLAGGPHGYVLERIQRAIQKYLRAFNLIDSLAILES